MLLLIVFCIPQAVTHAAATTATSVNGLLWSRQGSWAGEDGRDLKAGDAIVPGELLRPSASDGRHQVIVLLPDGQRLFYQCFNGKDCARGFRVPRLNARPSPFAIRLLDSIRSELSSGQYLATEPAVAHSVPAAQDELVTTLASSAPLRLTGLAATLPAGHYTYDLSRIEPGHAQAQRAMQRRVPLEKTAAPVLLPLERPGFYDVRIADSFNAQRIHLLVFATPAADTTSAANFKEARQTLDEWNEKSGGWPTHPLLRLYLLSLGDPALPK